ncbi:hypothetical protein FZEAL_4826 [Fusarium zealandicum]|uniref:Azaphilone pigments biosynthesis cluster protein L N-terminal domain-containing protein n=1 Tax=Fusarium zealandicum TaxID=1053134 RepID=A0A8H4ULF8_9HYPO|nr:hypothetical protein FZEAL_4826 [Fusarium zealandicum]
MVAKAPNVLRLSETQDMLELLTTQLTTPSESPRFIDSLIEQVKLDKSLELTQSLCNEFQDDLKGYTRHSTDSRTSSRDRIVISFQDSKIKAFNSELGSFNVAITTALTSINVIKSGRIHDDIAQLSQSLASQERDLIATGEQLGETQRTLISLVSEEADGQGSGDAATDKSFPLTPELEDICKRTYDAVNAKRTGQKLGIMELDSSRGVQGLVGVAQQGLEQSFGDLRATNESRGFQGQMDINAFDKLFN